jgi:drug/metabolite transporter (DMT)-like permease
LYIQVSPAAVSLLRFFPMLAVCIGLSAFFRESLRYPDGKARRFLFLGLLWMGVYMALFLEGMKGSTPAEGAIILAVAPVLTMLFEAMAGFERLDRGVVLGSLSSFAGVGMVVLGAPQQGHGTWIGNLLVFISAIVWSYAGLHMRWALTESSPLRVLTLSMPGGLIVLLPYGLTSVLQVDFPSLTSQSWLMLAFVTLFAGVIAFLCFFKGVSQVGAGGAMLYQYLVPPLAALFGWLALGQTMNPLQIAGLIVVLVGVAWTNNLRRKNLANHPQIETPN